MQQEDQLLLHHQQVQLVPIGPNRSMTIRSILAAKSSTEKPGVIGPAVAAGLVVVADKLIGKVAHAV